MRLLPHTTPNRPTLRTIAFGAVALAIAGTGALATPSTAEAASAPADRPCPAKTTRPWCDTSISAERRAGLLLAELTKAEKISLLAGDDLIGVTGAEGTHTGTSTGIERLGVPTVYYSDGPVGPRQGKATGMPSPMSVAASFSESTAAAHAGIVGNEVRNKGNDAVFAPGVNILRTPLNGRTFEYFGEDPYLTSRLSTAWITSVQKQGVLGNVKHFAVNNQEGIGISADGLPLGVGIIGSRFTLNAKVDERTLREIYLPAFESAVTKGNVATVMCAYPRVNGQFACENKHLLSDILKGDWGFKGFVLTDYGAAKNPIASLNNGLDLDIFPGAVLSPAAVTVALATGQVSTSTIDEHVRRILRTMFAYGVFDRAPYVDDPSAIDGERHHVVAGKVEADGIVLLKNDRSVLPLARTKVKTLAVIGPEADVIKDGGGSSAINEFRTTTPLAALRSRLGAANVVYDNGSDAARAAKVAASADAAVVIVGDKMTEGTDKLEPTLNSGQTDGIDRDALVSAVGRAQPRTVAVLQSGGPVLTPFRNDVPALLEMWFPGQNGGTALADVLFGDAEPGGRLPATFPASAQDLPTAGDPWKYPGVLETVKYLEGVLVGYRHYDAKKLAVAYPFGHGLGYTSFSYGRPTVKRGTGGTVADVTFTVKNTGQRTGSTVPQLYVGMPAPRAGVVQPPNQLKGFTKVSLKPGETRSVTLKLDRRALSYWDVAEDDWSIASGCYTVTVGTSSRADLKSASAGWSRTCGGLRLN